MKLVLASTSKFKKEILNNVGLKHRSIASEEKEIKTKNPYDYAKEKSYNKALSIINQVTKDEIIIGLDTIVLINNKIVEKPKSLKEVQTNLKNASNNITKIITGYTLINKSINEIVTDYKESIVEFEEIKDKDIKFYIENEKDAMYASGFIIETICSNFIKKIEGSYYNILGVPVESIYKTLNKWDIYLKDIEE